MPRKSSDPGHALLNAVDHRELGVALGPLTLQLLSDMDVGQCHGCLRRQHRQQVAVGILEAAGSPFDVGVEVAQRLLLRDQRCNQARALVARVRPFRPVPQARGAGPSCRLEPGGNGMQQRSSIFALRHQRAGDTQAVGAAQHQQNASGAGEMRCFVDQSPVQGVAVTKCVQVQTSADQVVNELVRRHRRRGAPVVQFGAPAFVPDFALARHADCLQSPGLRAAHGRIGGPPRQLTQAD